MIFYLFFFIILLQQAKAKTPPVVDETEKMREELLRAEAELIQLKKMQVEQQILEAKKSLQVSNIIIHYFSKPVKSVITAEIKASCLSTVVISLRASLISTVVIYSPDIITYFLWADEFVPSIVCLQFLKSSKLFFSSVVRGMKLNGCEMLQSLDLTCRVKKDHKRNCSASKVTDAKPGTFMLINFSFSDRIMLN